MTGAQASVVRAAIMGIIAQMATNIGRIYYPTNALALSGTVMLLQNPKLLRFDIGFQLSFLAVMGLVYITPLLEDLFPKLPQFLKNYLLPTLAAQIASAPLILFNFDRLSLISPVVNLLILPIIPLAMAVSFLTGMLAIISPAIGQIISWLTWLLLHTILKIIEIASLVPFASIIFNRVSLIIPIIFYFALLLMLMTAYYRKSWKQEQNN